MIKLDFEIALYYTIFDPSCDLLFNIHAAMTRCQTVLHENLYVDQATTTDLQTDVDTGNRWLRMQGFAGPLTVRYNATISISHYMTPPEQLMEVPIAQMPLSVLEYLNPSRYCQSDRLQKFALNEFGHLPRGYTRVKAIHDWVLRRVRFSVQTSNASTSAMDTLVEQVGVCRDFAHLMIALCRALTIPARFTTGIDYGAALDLGPPDFHAYVEVYLSGRWYIVDASGLTVPMGLIRLGTGRDASDVAFATLFGSVKSSMPQIKISAIEDFANNYEIPYNSTDILSTDP
ncbi:MAG: transglutaminase domain protein [Verrucomicrobiaceae bacterium]|nr:transglutaminase domain protein [Verrucomicrobiaceae bacterium]